MDEDQKDPQTPEEWQNAVDAAAGALALQSARVYGLIVGGPEVVVGRCAEILAVGKAKGFTPRPDAVSRFADELLSPVAD